MPPAEGALTSAEQQQMGEILLAAAALEPARRETYLRGLTLSRPAVLAQVRHRLALAAELPESFLAVPAAELLATAESLGEPVLRPAERYELLELAGEGGMATVYRAFDRQLRRPVALKFLHGTGPVLAEAQAQARVRHEHVLDVYETGELEGRPYVALRWVEGKTLGEVPGETSLEEKVRLLLQVAEGLHAAHRQGLLHRDVKPANVLVERTADGALKAWVTDFGLAGEAEILPAGLAGTPAYLAPELLAPAGPAEGPPQVDRRADVYSLGVTAYEVLSGRLPFCGGDGVSESAADLGELLRQICEEAPPPPRRHAPTLPAELEAVVLRAMARDPEARYPSTRAVADDLRRFLDGQVVEAHAATLAYRLSKFALRHRRLLAVAAVAGVLLLIALAVAAAMGLVAQAADRRAQLRRQQAEELLSFTLTDLRQRLEPVGRLDLLDGVGQRALAYFAAVPREELTDEELARRSQALYQIGEVRIRRGDLAGAVAPLEESLRQAQALAEREPRSDPRLFGLGQSHFWLGYALWEQGRRQDRAVARRHFERYLEISRELVRRAPGHAPWRLELAYAHSNLGSVLEAEGELEDALDRFRTTLALNRDLAAEAPADLALRSELASSHNLVGQVLLSLGHLGEAREHLEAELALRQALTEAEPENLLGQELLGTSHDYLASLAEQEGDFAAAEAATAAAGEIFEALVAHDGANATWRTKLALAQLKKGRQLRRQGRPAEALEVWRQVEEAADALVAEPGPHRDGAWLGAVAALQQGLAHWDLRVGDPERLEAAAEAGRRAAGELEALLADGGEAPRELLWLARAELLLSFVAEARKGTEPGGTARHHGERALACLDRLPGQRRDPFTRATRVLALIVAGRRDEARPEAEALLAEGYAEPELRALWLPGSLSPPDPFTSLPEETACRAPAPPNFPSWCPSTRTNPGITEPWSLYRSA